MLINCSVFSDESPEHNGKMAVGISENRSNLDYIIEKSMHRNRKDERENELLKDQYLCFRFILSGSIMYSQYGKVKTSTTSICTQSRRVSRKAHSVAQKHKK